MKSWPIACCLLFFLAGAGARGADLYVSHWGAGTPPYDTWDKAATNLSDALAAAQHGDTVWVTNGVYRTGTADGGGLGSRASLGRHITLIGLNGYSNTVIEGLAHTAATNLGADAVRAVFMTNGVLDGFTIRRGFTDTAGTAAQVSGGGLFMGGGTALSCRVAGNYGQTAGGASLENCFVADSVFEMNFSETGPRVKVNQGVRLDHCRLNNASVAFPDARILGTNGAVIANADRDLNTNNGTWFGKVVTGEAYTNVFTLTNAGPRELDIVAWSTNGGDAGDFVLAPPTNRTLVPGDAVSFSVTFSPSAVGPRETAVWMACNDPDDDPYVLWLKGDGIQAEMVVLATNFCVITNGSLTPLPELNTEFGDARTLSDVITNTYIITNAGSAELYVTNLVLTGWDAAEFAVVELPLGTVGVGGTTNFSVVFDPSVVGLRTTLVEIAHNVPDTPYTFMIRGRGVEPELRVLGTNLAWIPNGDLSPELADGSDFGVCVADPIRHVFTITNAGTSLLTLTNTPHVRIAGDHPGDFTVTAQPALSLLGTNDATTFEIEFFPQVATTRTADVIIYSDDSYHTNEVYTFRIQGTGTSSNHFIKINANLHNVGASSMAWGDYNNDGRLDLAVMGYDGTNRFTDVYRNLGGGVFAPITGGFTQVESGRLAWSDYNSDGQLDLSLMGYTPTGVVTLIYRNMGDGTFSNLHAGLQGAYNGGFAWGDYDNDGDPDLALSGYTQTNIIARVYRNDNGVFTPMNFGLLPVRDGRASWIDFDRDGLLDLMLAGDDGTRKYTRMYKNYNGSSFSNYPAASFIGVSYGGMSWGDLDRDGDLDLALTGYSTETGMVSYIYRYNGGVAPFARTSDRPEPVWLGDCEWGDFDNDGRPDFLLAGAGTNSTRNVRVYRNSSGALTNLSTGMQGMRVTSVTWGDYDNDGDLDIAMAGQATNGYQSSVYRNIAPASNQPPTAPSNLSAVLTNGNEMIFTWDAATDPEGGTLTYNLYVGDTDNATGIMSPLADITTGLRRVVGLGNTQTRREWRLKNLPTGRSIVWGVQAVDAAYAGGPFAHGATQDVPPLPDFVIAGLAVQLVPFAANVTVSNRGAAAGNAGWLSVWANHTNLAICGQSADQTNTTIGTLNAGSCTTIQFAGFTLPSAVATNTFLAYINSACTEDEENHDNNQMFRSYTLQQYETFWFNAMALTDNVYLRWSNPTNCGMGRADVLIHFDTANYPASTNVGTKIYQGTDQMFNHTGRPAGIPNYYTIWVTHDGVTWIEPPE